MVLAADSTHRGTPGGAVQQLRSALALPTHRQGPTVDNHLVLLKGCEYK